MKFIAQQLDPVTCISQSPCLRNRPFRIFSNGSLSLQWFPLLPGCRDDAVVRALDSHQCGPGSIPRLGVICGLSLLVLYSAPRGFLRVLRFPLSSKTDI